MIKAGELKFHLATINDIGAAPKVGGGKRWVFPQEK